MDFLIKLERDAKKIKYAKEVIATATGYMQDQQGLSGVRVDVDSVKLRIVRRFVMICYD